MRLVDAVTDECGAGDWRDAWVMAVWRRLGDGVMTTPAGSGVTASFRPGQSIHECAVSAPVGRSRD